MITPFPGSKFSPSNLQAGKSPWDTKDQWAPLVPSHTQEPWPYASHVWCSQGVIFQILPFQVSGLDLSLIRHHPCLVEMTVLSQLLSQHCLASVSVLLGHEFLCCVILLIPATLAPNQKSEALCLNSYHYSLGRKGRIMQIGLFTKSIWQFIQDTNKWMMSPTN